VKAQRRRQAAARAKARATRAAEKAGKKKSSAMRARKAAAMKRRAARAQEKARKAKASQIRASKRAKRMVRMKRGRVKARRQKRQKTLLARQTAWESPRSGAMAGDDSGDGLDEEIYGGENRQILLKLGGFIRNRHLHNPCVNPA